MGFVLFWGFFKGNKSQNALHLVTRVFRACLYTQYIRVIVNNRLFFLFGFQQH